MIVLIVLLLALLGGTEDPTGSFEEVVIGGPGDESGTTPPSGLPGPHPK